MTVLIHVNHDNLPKVTPVQNFCSGFDLPNLESSFCSSQYLPKFRLSNMYFFKYEHIKLFV